MAVAWQHGCRVTRITDKNRQTIKFPSSKQAAGYIGRLKNVIIKLG